MALDEQAFETLLGEVIQVKKGLDGWCTDEKARHLIKHVLESRPDIIVEIGVFGGSSFVPMLMALRSLGSGHAHGIDPWSVDAALENMKADTNREWWGSLNLDNILKKLEQHLAIQGLAKFCTLHRMKSEEAVSKFEDGSIGLLHIDGNHSEAQSYADATQYFPKVKPGGLIVFDDIWWTDGGEDVTTRQAILFLLERCERLGCVGDCMVLQKKPDSPPA